MMIPNVILRRGVSPFETVNGVRQQFDRWFDQYATGLDETWTMPSEIVETQDEMRFAIEVPGLRPEDIELTVENGVLTVSGEKKMVRREGETEDDYRLFERRYGRYTRSFRLPSTVDTNRVQASCDNGVLTVRLPRVEEAKPRRIQVTTGDNRQVTDATLG